MTLQEIKLLHAFNAWANNRIFEALQPLPAEEVTRDMKSSHGSIHGTIAHMAAAEKIWLSRLVGSPDKDLMPASAMPTLADVRAVWESTGYGIAKYLGGMTDRKLQETFSVTYASGKTYTYITWQAFQHVVDHSTYHRGQIITMLRQLGHQPPSTGLIGFYRDTVKTS